MHSNEFILISKRHFLPAGTSYSTQEHRDLNYVNFTYCAMHMLWEKDDSALLDLSELEDWYEFNIWSKITLFRNRSSSWGRRVRLPLYASQVLPKNVVDISLQQTLISATLDITLFDSPITITLPPTPFINVNQQSEAVLTIESEEFTGDTLTQVSNDLVTLLLSPLYSPSLSIQHESQPIGPADLPESHCRQPRLEIFSLAQQKLFLRRRRSWSSNNGTNEYPITKKKMFAFIPIESNHDDLVFQIPFNNSENYYHCPTTSMHCHPHAYFNRVPTHRHESYANNLENIISELKHLERKRAEEKTLYEKRQRIYAEREKEIRQRAYRQWILDQQVKQEALKHIFELRAATAASNEDPNVYNHSCSHSCRKQQSRKQIISKQEAAKRIILFIRRRIENQTTLLIINKLRQLRSIEQHLFSLFPKSGFNPHLTFVTENAKQILPITANNRAFLLKEESILKTLDSLDRIESNGIESIRERRKQIVRVAQRMLEVLDNIKNKQWKEFGENEDKQEGSEKVETNNTEREDNKPEVIRINNNDDSEKSTSQEHEGKFNLDEIVESNIEIITPFIISDSIDKNSNSELDENNILNKSTSVSSKNTETTSNVIDNVDDSTAISNKDSQETTIAENEDAISSGSVAAKEIVNLVNKNNIELENSEEFIVV
ncbi:1945_t:CDS:2 [Ambispora gerdemannii]|uniref:1945_t:CDS:1 n=1 Tax=Ambispora gerdemannii TaxID=144530 RepID=A0A9N9GZM9_9GLOM|nr:1945_t:CDS:2 [Ambispora gerdemannii]